MIGIRLISRCFIELLVLTFLTQKRSCHSKNEHLIKCKHCKVIPGENLTTHHGLLVLDVYTKCKKKRKKINEYQKVR